MQSLTWIRLRQRFATAAALLSMGVTSILAQTNKPAAGGSPAPPPPNPGLAQRAQGIPSDNAAKAPGVPARPERVAVPPRPEPAKAVKDLVKDFQTARQDFIRQQQELNRQFKSATEEQRAAIRAQLKENLDAWREEQKAHLQELREQAKDIKNNVPSIKDVIDAGGGEGRGR